jgi:hypothetical protein
MSPLCRRPALLSACSPLLPSFHRSFLAEPLRACFVCILSSYDHVQRRRSASDWQAQISGTRSPKIRTEAPDLPCGFAFPPGDLGTPFLGPPAITLLCLYDAPQKFSVNHFLLLSEPFFRSSRFACYYDNRRVTLQNVRASDPLLEQIGFHERYWLGFGQS